MPCYYPLDAWQKRPGVKPIFKLPARRELYTYLQLPCGQCIGCRLERSRQWAMRCLHEADQYTENCFLTLTYADNPLSLRKSDFQKFMKRLRKALSPLTIRYFMCGEYGEKFSRPHFHACIFNYRPTDLTLFSCRDGINLYTSDFLSLVWGYGFVTVGDVTFESAAYVARYVMKKINGDLQQEHYEYVDDYGEVIDRLPEYCDMSRRPGIGHAFYQNFKRDLEKDFLTMRGVKMRPPRYYDKLLHQDDEESFLQRKEQRKAKALLVADDNVPARLSVKRQIKERKLRKLERGFENEI